MKLHRWAQLIKMCVMDKNENPCSIRWAHRWAQLIKMCVVDKNENSCSFSFWVICLWSDPGQFVKLCGRDKSVCENRPLLLNHEGYFDKILPPHWYWQDLAQGIAKCHFSSVEALTRSEFWKRETGPISWNIWNILMKFPIHIDIDKIYPRELQNIIFHWSRLCWGLYLYPRHTEYKEVYSFRLFHKCVCVRACVCVCELFFLSKVSQELLNLGF